jgi:exodeoxyribonuclease VII large subunit
VGKGMRLDHYGEKPPGEAPEEPEGEGEIPRRRFAADLPPFFTVSELTDLIEDDLRRDDRLRGVFVKGEISGLKEYPRAWYFTLKDADSQIAGVCWNYGPTREVGAQLKEGAEVIARGDVTVYKQRGQYQLRVTEVQPTDKRGALFLKFEATKKKLAAEGLFDEANKRPLPRFPRTVGVVTSTEGAVVRDIINVITRRFPHVRLLVAPARVQGEGAELEVIRGIEALNRFGGVEVIIVARGGGSIEDLWPFNEEALARAVRASAVPVVSAVGHQTDFTICDFAADVRAPTPSAAAEIVVPSADEVFGGFEEREARITRALLHARDRAAGKLERLTHHPALRLPRTLLEARQQMLDEVADRLRGTSGMALERAHARLDRHTAALEVLSPLKTLARGYAIALDRSGAVLRSASGVNVGDEVDVILSEGEIAARVQAKGPGRLGPRPAKGT